MPPKHFSARGQPVDMDRLRNIHGDRRAIGNASVNARGDKLGAGGVILKTQEQIEAEWAAARAKMPPKPMDIRSQEKIEAALARLAPTVKPDMPMDDGQIDPPVAAANPRRKVIDRD
jgi:hypothetical protein